MPAEGAERSDDGALGASIASAPLAVERAELERLLLAAREATKRQIGRDLHDGLGQLLVGAALTASSLIDHAPAHLHGDLARLTAALNEAVNRLQRIARGLAPVRAGERSLAEALRAAGASSGARITLVVEPRAEFEPDSVKSELCLIAEEAIGNAVRHGRASRVDLELVASDARLTLVIRDNGVGLELPYEAGIGIESMRARARALGGVLELGSAEGGGTVVRCVWPAARAEPVSLRV